MFKIRICRKTLKAMVQVKHRVFDERNDQWQMFFTILMEGICALLYTLFYISYCM